MQSPAVVFQDLLLLGLSIRSIRRSRSMVTSPGPRSLSDDDRIVREDGKELAARFSVTGSQLPVCIKMRDHRRIQDEALT
jgi:hypothetical protein